MPAETYEQFCEIKISYYLKLIGNEQWYLDEIQSYFNCVDSCPSYFISTLEIQINQFTSQFSAEWKDKYDGMEIFLEKLIRMIIPFILVENATAKNTHPYFVSQWSKKIYDQLSPKLKHIAIDTN